MTDLVERLRASVTQCRAVDRSALLEEAADEIERLWITAGTPIPYSRIDENRGDSPAIRDTNEQRNGAVSPITDAELDAIGWAMAALAGQIPEAQREALRGLLERLQ